MRLAITAGVLVCASAACAQTPNPHAPQAAASAVQSHPAYLPPVSPFPRTVSNPHVPHIARAAAQDIPNPIRNTETEQLATAISELARKVDSMHATSMPHPVAYGTPQLPVNGMPVQAANCGFEAQSCDDCTEVLMVREAPAPMVTVSEPPIIQQSGGAPGCMSGVASGVAGRIQSGATQAFQWRASVCDILFGRTSRQVGPYLIDVRPGFFKANITVSQ